MDLYKLFQALHQLELVRQATIDYKNALLAEGFSKAQANKLTVAVFTGDTATATNTANQQGGQNGPQ